MIEHILAEHEKKLHEMVYRNYVADLLKGLLESMGGTVGERYFDLIKKKPKETKTGDEIALEVIQRAGLKVKENDTI